MASVTKACHLVTTNGYSRFRFNKNKDNTYSWGVTFLTDYMQHSQIRPARAYINSGCPNFRTVKATSVAISLVYNTLCLVS